MLDKNEKIMVLGGGGFIGDHLVKKLLDQGYTNIQTVAIKPIDAKSTKLLQKS